ncbi:DNA methyltransferase [Bifidobacterium callitrichidarum]|uniref:DNA methyltransferase n=1 Tax=Bifidobacterium callitrichidarum TaxID=2052941 RepID=UPI001F4E4A91|nr:DNA methyltransferase [Bifidobacterium callitrichidarum]
MTVTYDDSQPLKERARTFAQIWAGRGDEKSETQQFWRDMLDHVLLVENTSDRQTLWFERRTALSGYIDALMIKARVLVEQKSGNIDLDKPEERQKTQKTPVQQALDYANALPPSEKPGVIITCNFNTFRLYDLETDPIASKPQSEFALQDLPAHISEIARLFTHEHSRVVQQEKLSVEAGQRVARLHDGLAKCFPNPDDPVDHDALAMITVRLVFCLYAEDAGLFKADALRDYVAGTSYDRLNEDLFDLFKVLDTPVEERRRYLSPRLASFPYVDGGLFAETIDVPPLTEELYTALLDISEGFDWSGISPVIFGSLMEETLSHDERRKGGMHYTSVKNIHRVIDPLFLDELNEELQKAESLSIAGGARKKALDRLHDKIAGLRFLDPACGSGNFLTETFLQLRRIENRILTDLNNDGQLTLDLDGDYNPVKVSIDHFYGIEINNFACAVARTALWIAEQQALDDTESTISGLPRLPFTDTAHIVQGNALQLDWNEILPGDQCDYVMGNPPFIGQYLMSDSQKKDMKEVWGKNYDGYLDYVTGWFRKTSRYLIKDSSSFALVSTNSITQGQPVSSLFKPLIADGWQISFAHRTFAWDAQSTDNAHVHVVIIGMGRDTTGSNRHVLFEYPNIDGDPIKTSPSHINGYLIDGPEAFVEKRTTPLSPDLPEVVYGSKPTDGGGFSLDDQEINDAVAQKYVRKFIGARELINGDNRWCLWLKAASASDMMSSKLIRTRLDQIKEFRLASTKRQTQEASRTPQLFTEDRQPDVSYLAIPCHFSGRRTYATCDRFTPDVILGNSCFLAEDEDGFAFSIIESRMFMAWQKAVGGRIKSDCRFSNTIVWNNLPLPRLSETAKAKIMALLNQN